MRQKNIKVQRLEKALDEKNTFFEEIGNRIQVIISKIQNKYYNSTKRLNN